MGIQYRIVSAAALLLHSIFGCGMHQVCRCAAMQQEATVQQEASCQIAATEAAPPSCCELDTASPAVHHPCHDSAVNRRHSCEGGEITAGRKPAGVDSIVGLCGDCQRSPISGNFPANDANWPCHFVPVVDVDVPLGDCPQVWLTARAETDLQGRSIETVGARDRSWDVVRGVNASSRCAAFCTWQL